MSLIVDIEKKFNNFTLAISFETKKQYLGILGASGSGKSLCLKCIAGIETPDKGKIIYNGKELYNSEKGINLKPQDREIGYLFQNYALFPKMTVRENILVGEKSQNINEIINKFSLKGIENLYPHQLSGGQQQRVALARMMMKKPKLILLDEPFSAMDSYLKEELQSELKFYIEEQGQEYVFVTHNKEELYAFSQEIALVDKGSVLIHKDTKALFEDPEYVQTARLLACQNILEMYNIDKVKGLFETKCLPMLFDKKSKIPIGMSHIALYSQDFKTKAENQDDASYLFEIKEKKEKSSTCVYILKPAGQECQGGIYWEVDKANQEYAIGETVNLYLDSKKIKLLRK